MKIYKEYIDNVIHKTEEFKDNEQLLDRYHTLAKTNKELTRKRTELSGILSSDKKEYEAKKNELNSE